MKRLVVVQVLPALDAGGVERGTLEIGRALVAEGHRSIVVSAGGRLESTLRSEGSEHVALPIGVKSPLTFLRCILPLRRLLASTNADILHVRSRMPAWVAWWAWRGMDAAHRPHFMTTYHGTYTPGLWSSIMTKGEKVIAVSETIRSHIATHYPRTSSNDVTVIHRGVDPAEFPRGYVPPPDIREAFFKAHPLTRERRRLLLPARLTRWKGQEDFLDLLANLVARGRDVHGFFLGDTHPRRREFKSELERKVCALGLGNRVTFLGHRSDVRDVMALSDVVFSLSRDPEAFGRVSLEALSLGRPVVAYDHGGVGEQMRVLLPEGAVAVGDVVAAADRTDAFLEKAPEIAADHPFTLATMQRATLAIYRELADRRR